MTRKKPPVNPIVPVTPNPKTGHVCFFVKTNGVWTCLCGATK